MNMTQWTAAQAPAWATLSKVQMDYARRAGVPVATELDLGDGVTLKVVLIPRGVFRLGSNDSAEELKRIYTEPNHYDCERPLHEVGITTPFYIGVTPVTQAEYVAVMGKNPSHFTGFFGKRRDNQPADNMSWNDATEYCKKVSLKAAGGTRLPTEAEWEYGCRAGATSRFSFGDSEGDLGDYAWYDRNSDGKTHPVGTKKPNGWGLYDMHGNVWEWCQDWYDENYYGESPKEDPKGPAAGQFRVMRGGSWCDPPWRVRCSYSGGFAPERGSSAVGFRVVVPARTR